MSGPSAMSVRRAILVLASGALAHGLAMPATALATEQAQPANWVAPSNQSTRPLPRQTAPRQTTPRQTTQQPDWVRRPAAPRSGARPGPSRATPQAAPARGARRPAQPQPAQPATTPASSGRPDWSPRTSGARTTQSGRPPPSVGPPAPFTPPPGPPGRVLAPEEAAAVRRANATAAGLDVPARAPDLPATLPPEAAPVLPTEPNTFRLNQTGQTVSLPVPLVSGTRELGSVTVQVSPDDRIAIDRSGLVAAVSQALTPEGVAELEARIGSDQTVTVSALGAAGYATVLELETMTLKIALPPNGRWPVELAVSPRRVQYSGEVAAPADVSAYVNLRGNLDYIWSETGDGLVAPDIFMDAAGRVGPLAWETEATLRTNSDDPGVTRQGTRVIYDNLNRGTRLVVGDQANPTRSFLGSTPAAAISLSSSPNQFTPDAQSRNPGEQTVTVLRPSTIEAIVNNQSVRTFRVEPGVYRFSDFPFAQGANDLRLEITDDSGGREVVSVSLFVERSLLEPGQSEFNVTAGVEAGVDPDGLSYDSDRPFVSGYYTAGVNEHLTLGVSGQATIEGLLGGVEARVGLASGILSLDAALSSREDSGEGVAANLAYSARPDPAARNPMGVGLSVQYVSDGFSSVFGDAGTSPFEWQFAASMSRAFGPATSLNASLRHSISQTNDETASSALISLTRRFATTGALSLEADYTRDSEDEGWGFRLGYVQRLGDRSSARFDYASANNQAGLAWLNSAGQGIGATTTNIELRHSEETTSGVAAIGRVGHWIDGGLSHSLAYASATSQVQDQRTSARFATAIAYADGALAISRPISGGFAIFVPDPTLNGAAIELEPREDGYEARSFVGMPVVANNLGAHALRQVAYGVPDAPIGYDIGSGSVAMRAPYRGGYRIPVGSRYNQSAVGRLEFADGSPVALLSGYAVEASSLGGAGREPIELFTNAAGRFGVTGLRAGRWIIEMQGETSSQFELIVPEIADGIHDAGTLRPITGAPWREAAR